MIGFLDIAITPSPTGIPHLQAKIFRVGGAARSCSRGRLD
jgi:hypothetical protein